MIIFKKKFTSKNIIKKMGCSPSPAGGLDPNVNQVTR
jgi:hypothetical protein